METEVKSNVWGMRRFTVDKIEIEYKPYKMWVVVLYSKDKDSGTLRRFMANVLDTWEEVLEYLNSLEGGKNEEEGD